MEKSCSQIHLEQVELLYRQINENHFEKIKDFFQTVQQVPTWEEFANNHTNHQFIIKESSQHNKPQWDGQALSCLNYTCLFYCLKNQVHPLEMNKGNWSEIGKCYLNIKGKVVRSRWLQQQSYSIDEQPWSREEDQGLQKIYNQMMEQGKSNKWGQVSIELCIRCQTKFIRQGKQCRDRWINRLNPDLEKGPWYKDEELLLFEAVSKEGKKWSKISVQYFQYKRSENALKNRFYTLYNKETKKHKHPNQELQYNITLKAILEQLKLFVPNQHKLYQQVAFKNFGERDFEICIIKKSKIHFI